MEICADVDLCGAPEEIGVSRIGMLTAEKTSIELQIQHRILFKLNIHV